MYINRYTTIECSDIGDEEEYSKKNGKTLASTYSQSQIWKTRVVNQAWLIYLYFVSPDSAFEVGLSHTLFNSVSRNMAAPTRDLFANVRTAVQKVLEQHFDNFKSAPCFDPVFGMCKQRQVNKDKIMAEARAREGPVSTGCFGF